MSNNKTLTKLFWGLSGLDGLDREGSNISFTVNNICKLTGLSSDESEEIINSIKEGLKEMSDYITLNKFNQAEDIFGYAEEISAYWWFNNGESCWTLDKPDWWDQQILKSELINFEGSLLRLSNKLQALGFYDIFDNGNIEEILSTGSIYVTNTTNNPNILIDFIITEDKSNLLDTIIKILDIN